MSPYSRFVPFISLLMSNLGNVLANVANDSNSRGHSSSSSVDYLVTLDFFHANILDVNQYIHDLNMLNDNCPGEVSYRLFYLIP